jgi:hypothetical protein
MKVKFKSIRHEGVGVEGRSGRLARPHTMMGLPCVSLFSVIDVASTGSRGRTWGLPVDTLCLNSDPGYADLPLTLLGAPVSVRGEASVTLAHACWPRKGCP